METLKKIYYIPGMISAILITLIFWYLGNRELQRPIPNVMDLGIPAKYNPKIPLEQQLSSLEGVRNFNYQKIIVRPNSAKINSKFYVSEIKKLQARNQKKTGIEFILNNENSYGDFVSILNDLAIAKHNYYGLDLDKTGHLFTITEYKDPNKIDEPCYLCNDTVSMTYYQYKYQEIVSENKYSKWFVDLLYSIKPSFLDFLNLIKSSLFLVFGYSILFCICVFRIKKYL